MSQIADSYPTEDSNFNEFANSQPNLPAGYVSISEVGPNTERESLLVFSPQDLKQTQNIDIFLDELIIRNNIEVENGLIILNYKNPVSQLAVAIQNLPPELVARWFDIHTETKERITFNVGDSNTPRSIQGLSSSQLVIRADTENLGILLNQNRNETTDSIYMPSKLWANAMHFLHYNREIAKYSDKPQVGGDVVNILGNINSLHDFLIFCAYADIEWNLILAKKTPIKTIKDKLQDLAMKEFNRVNPELNEIYSELYNLVHTNDKEWVSWNLNLFNNAKAFLKQKGIEARGESISVRARSAGEFSFYFKNAGEFYIRVLQERQGHGRTLTSREFFNAKNLMNYYLFDGVNAHLDHDHAIYDQYTQSVLVLSSRKNFEKPSKEMLTELERYLRRSTNK